MDIDQAKQERKDIERVESLPSIQVTNIKRASQQELAEMVLDLRLWCGQVLMELKDVRQQLQERNEDVSSKGTSHPN